MFTQHKNTFTFQRICLALTLGFYVISIMLGAFLLHWHQEHQVNVVKQMLVSLEDMLLIEEEYVRDDFQRITDVGMFSNMYQKQLNLALVPLQERNVLFSRILDSVSLVLARMKKRHVIDPFNVIKSVRSSVFFNPTWIPISNMSFEFNAFRNEMKYFEVLQSFIKIS